MHDDLKTARLFLRPLRQEDASAFAKLANNFSIAKMTGTLPHPFPKRSVEGMIDIFKARAATGRAYHWSILHKGEFIGVVGLSRDGNGWELGYWLGEPFWGRGYAKEALSALLAHLTTLSDRLAITAGVFIDNPASSKLLLKLGFKKRETCDDAYSIARDARQSLDVFEYVNTASDASKAIRTAKRAPGLMHSIASVAPLAASRETA